MMTKNHQLTINKRDNTIAINCVHMGFNVIDFNAICDDELLKLRISVEKEMQNRNIGFSVGVIGEQKTIEFFNNTRGLPNLQLAPVGTKNVDALSREGERYSIKTIQKSKKTGTIYPDGINKNNQLFEHLIILRIDDEYEIDWIYLFKWSVFKKIRLWDKRMSAWYVNCSNNTLTQGKCLYAKI